MFLPFNLEKIPLVKIIAINFVRKTLSSMNKAQPPPNLLMPCEAFLCSIVSPLFIAPKQFVLGEFFCSIFQAVFEFNTIWSLVKRPNSGKLTSNLFQKKFTKAECSVVKKNCFVLYLSFVYLLWSKTRQGEWTYSKCSYSIFFCQG